MSDMENFHLARNDFDACTRNTFKNLWQDGEVFADVTLACRDKQLKAHKVILSACSPFFRQVLTSNPHPHPLVYLKGISGPDLDAIVGFIYQGETNVTEEQLDSFLSSAQELQVAGLRMAGGSEKGRSKADLTVVVAHEEDLPGQQVQSNEDLVGADELAAVVRGADNKFHCPKCDFASTYKHNITRHMASKTVHPDPHGHEVGQQEGRLTMETPNEESKEGAMADDEVTASQEESAAGVSKVVCEECDFSTVLKRNLRRHVQRVHTKKEEISDSVISADIKGEKLVEEGNSIEANILVYTCDSCENTSRNKWDMSRHILRVHKEMKYLCDNCDFKSSKTSKLREHNQNSH